MFNKEIIEEFEEQYHEIDNLINCVKNDSLSVEQCEKVCEYLEINKKLIKTSIKQLKKGL